MDEDALNVLLAEGIDVPTAIAGSMKDQPPAPQPGFRAGLMLVWIPIAGVIVYFALRLLA